VRLPLHVHVRSAQEGGVAGGGGGASGGMVEQRGWRRRGQSRRELVVVVRRRRELGIRVLGIRGAAWRILGAQGQGSSCCSRYRSRPQTHAHSHSLELLVVRRQVLLVALQGQRGGGQDSGRRLGRVEGAGGGAARQAVGGGRGQALPTG